MTGIQASFDRPYEALQSENIFLPPLLICSVCEIENSGKPEA